ncbi:MAG: hypothetical protein ACKN9K_10020, partial [Dolichospermum sp.]
FPFSEESVISKSLSSSKQDQNLFPLFSFSSRLLLYDGWVNVHLCAIKGELCHHGSSHGNIASTKVTIQDKKYC